MVKSEGGAARLVIDPKEWAEGNGEGAATLNVQSVAPAADDLAQMVTVFVVLRLRHITWVGCVVLVDRGADIHLNHAVSLEEEQPDLEAQLDGESGKRGPCGMTRGSRHPST